MSSHRTFIRLASRVAPARTGAWAARRFLSPPRRDLPVAAGATLTTVGGLVVYRWGEIGPIALLVHGWARGAGDLAAYVPLLLAKGYRVVAFDGPAHGASGGEAAHLPAFADAIRAVVAATGRIEVAIGHSIGAAALGRAVQHGLEVARMAWIAPAASVAAFARRFADGVGLLGRARVRYFEAIERIAGAPFDTLELSSIARDVTCPVVVVHDKEDSQVPAPFAAAVADALPVARHIVTRGLGHNRILAAPAVVRAAVAFVDDLRDCIHEPAARPLAA